MINLSVAISTRNEERNIKKCLESVKWADEIVVFDEKSTDKTVSLAKKYTQKIFKVDHDPMFHKTKQKAIDKCSGNWILQIDADEEVTKELRDEIQKSIHTEEFSAFKIPRKSLIFGKWMEHTGWYPDYQIKLFKKGLGHYPCQTVHEDITIASGKIGFLQNNLLHHHYQTISGYLARLDTYTTNDADFLLTRGESVVWSDAIKFPVDEFLKRFFYWEGYKDGLHGLVLSLLQAFNRLVVFAKIWERQGYWQISGDHFLNDAINIINKSRKDTNYWVVASTKNPASRLYRKIKNKLITNL